MNCAASSIKVAVKGGHDFFNIHLVKYSECCLVYFFSNSLAVSKTKLSQCHFSLCMCVRQSIYLDLSGPELLHLWMDFKTVLYNCLP